MRVVAIVQARMGSSRFPGKMLKPVGAHNLIEILLRRLRLCSELNEIVVATTTDRSDDALVDYVASRGFEIIRGSSDDVLSRYDDAASIYAADAVVRITGDCPLVDPELVDQCVREFRSSGVDYLSNNRTETFPDGLDVEVFSASALTQATKFAKKPSDREHVTPYIKESSSFSSVEITCVENLGGHRWTVDEPEDLAVIDEVVKFFAPAIDFSWREVLSLQARQPELFSANAHIVRNEGATMTKGQKLWRRAKKVIPGGNMLLSKRSEMFLPNQWPSYFQKTEGCHVWDIDGNRYCDMSIMGIGTNTLGYSHPEVDSSVFDVVSAGNMSSLNCPEEVLLAERLIALHPWADMVKFARSGGEANAVAVRIARAASGRDNVAICGYHGWHDWYLAANLGDNDGLDGHLLPGLNPKGVPKSLRGSVFPFEYNNLDALKNLVATRNIGVIKMEVMRNSPPEDDFLIKVRELASAHGIVLIFDECTSGFRECFGGLHKKYSVFPDIAMFGKALGNGYAITAVVGREEIMQEAQATFISSTFWTERIGPAAALKTLEVMEREKSWELISSLGSDVKAGWMRLAEEYELSISTFGLSALAGFNFSGPKALEYKTFLTQEMLKNGFLASNLFYASTAHNHGILDCYFEALEPIFSTVKACEEGMDINSLLEGPVCHAGFARLN